MDNHPDVLAMHDDLKRISEFMDDPELDEALTYVIQLIKKPDVPVAKVDKVIVKLSALATSFAFKATLFKGIAKGDTENRYKKDMYYTAKDSLRDLVDALKYIVRVQQLKD